MKYPENRKKDPIRPAITELPRMKFGTRALKQATREFDINKTNQTTKEK
jgi:hypothetical protein